MIRAIIFDNFGVLVDPVYTTLLRNLSDQDKKVFLSISDLADSGNITNVERDNQILPLIGGDRTSIAAAHAKARRNEELLTFILELRHTYKTGILSNAASGLVESFFSPEDMDKYFDDVILSYKVRMIKPDREMYLLAVDHLGVIPQECVFVDDSERNITAAESVGMQGIVYRNFAEFQTNLTKILAKDSTSNA